MIDLKLLRDDPEALRASQRARGEDPGAVDALLAADERRREAVGRADTLRAEQRQLGKKIGQARGDERTELLAYGKELAAQVKAAEAAQAEADEALTAAQRALPNLVIDGVPAGGEDDYVVLEHVGTPREFDFPVRDHVELLESLGG
ncbi:MAG: seryl-tRNA synthetase, partial [Pseudonocardiales bacterium]|nr:seryl-tRNA synthetase [Pseudonocardiales bacterium]